MITRADVARLTGSRSRGDAVRRSRTGTGRGGGAAPPRRESEIQRAILDYLALVPGVVAWRNNVGGMRGEYKGRPRFVRFGRRGLPDILGFRSHCMTGSFHNGRCAEERPAHGVVARFLAIEVKRPGQEPTPEQAAFLEQVRHAGGLAIVAHSLDDVRALLPAEPLERCALRGPRAPRTPGGGLRAGGTA